MKLPITSGAGAAAELKKVLGFLDANINFDNIRQEMTEASQEVYDILGKETYNYIASKYPYTTADYDNADQNLVRAWQYAICSRAYMLYAPSNDLSHTNDGRKMRNEEHEKNAFQWMIDADNEAQEKRYYRALDSLIKLLDNSKVESESSATIYTIWTTSDAYKQTQSLFIRNYKQFSKYIVIDSPYLFLKLCPGIDECETDEILPVIGSTKFEALKNKLKNAAELSLEEKKLHDLISRACANYAFADAIQKFSVCLLPDAVVQKYSSDRNSTKGSAPALKMEPEFAIQAYMRSFDSAITKLKEFVMVKPEDLSTLPTLPSIPDIDGGFTA